MLMVRQPFQPIPLYGGERIDDSSDAQVVGTVHQCQLTYHGPEHAPGGTESPLTSIEAISLSARETGRSGTIARRRKSRRNSIAVIGSRSSAGPRSGMTKGVDRR